MASYKNILQEYCQKNNLGMPIYTYKKVGGPDHKPLWELTLKVDNINNINNTVIIVDNNKKKADQQGAKQI